MMRARQRHPAILVTGMSGVGKSTALQELAARGCDVVDTDEGDWIEIVDGEPLWREDRIDELLRGPRPRPLFVQGTVANQGRFYPAFDDVVLLSAPLDVVLARVADRPLGEFGSSRADRDKIARDLAEVEPLLRAGATHVLDATRPIADVVAGLRTIAGL